MPTPMMALKKCPKIRLRGCDSGDSIALYSRMAAAPNEAMTNGGVCPPSRGKFRKTFSMIDMPMKPPRKENSHTNRTDVDGPDGFDPFLGGAR